MLKGIDPLLTGSLLKILDEMGHGDVLGLVDRNFPAYRYGVPVIDLRGADTEAATRAILSVFPLDGFVDAPVRRMEIDGEPDTVTDATTALGRLAAELDGSESAIHTRPTALLGPGGMRASSSSSGTSSRMAGW